MKDNEQLVISGTLVELVPYERRHVNKYHLWMQDPTILELTASEPLSLEEEYEMQVSWRNDPKKCTFIVLAKDDALEENDRMAGDVNLFLNDCDDPARGEIDIMIAEARYRRRGLGRQAVQLMMLYACKSLSITRIYAKINVKNEPSINLFKSLNFLKKSFVGAFQEFEFEWFADEVSIASLEKDLTCVEYHHLQQSLN